MVFNSLWPLCLALAFTLFAAPAFASPASVVPRATGAVHFPTRHVTIVVPFSAGGGTEARARILADALERQWERPVSVICLPGGAGITGMLSVKNAPPDGHTMVLATFGTAVLTPNRVAAGYTTPKDFCAVAQVSRAHFALGVLCESGIRSFPQLLDAARERDLTYGSPGAGLTQYTMFSDLLERTPVRMRHVPYQGAWEAVTALLAQHIKAVVLVDSDLLPLVSSGDVVVLATTGTERSSLFPQAPTFKELGFDTRPNDAWAGLLVPKATPEVTVQFLQQAVEKALQDPELLRRFNGSHIRANYLDGAALDAKIAKEYRESSQMITRLPH